MFSHCKKIGNANRINCRLCSLIAFTLASLLFLFCSSVKVYAATACAIAFSPRTGTPPMQVHWDWTNYFDADNSIPMVCTGGVVTNTNLSGPGGGGNFTVTGNTTCTVTVADSDGINNCPTTFTVSPCNYDNNCSSLSGENCVNCPSDCCPNPPGPPNCDITFNPTSGYNPTMVRHQWNQRGDDNNVVPIFCTNGGSNTNFYGVNGNGSFTGTATSTCTLTVSNWFGTSTCSATFTLLVCNNDGDCNDPGESCAVCPGPGDNCCPSGAPTCWVNGPSTVTPNTPFNITMDATNVSALCSVWSGTSVRVPPAPGGSFLGNAGTVSGGVCTASGLPDPDGGVLFGGVHKETGDSTSTLTIYATGPGGTTTCSHSVSVTSTPACNNNGFCDAGETCALCPTGDNCCPPPGAPTCSIAFVPSSGPGGSVAFSWNQSNDANAQIPMNCTNGGPTQNLNGTGGSGNFSATNTTTCTLTVVNTAGTSGTCSATFTVIPVCNNNLICDAGEDCGNCPNDCCPPACTLTLTPSSGTPATPVTFNWSQSFDANGQIPLACSNGGPNTNLTSPPNSGSGTFNPTSSGACSIVVANSISSVTCSANFTMTCNNNGICDPGETCAICPTLNNCCTCTGPLTFVPPAWVDPVLRDGSQSNPTQIRTIHFTQMRDRINALRADAGLSVFNWVGCGFTPANNAPISTKLINCPRQALVEVYTACSQPIPPGILGSVNINTPIRKQHVLDLRSAIDLAE